MASIYKGLRVSDAKRFYDATASIPIALQVRGLRGGLDNGIDTPPVQMAFVPHEMNALVPFFIESARSTDQEARTYALFHICIFNDPRLTDFLIQQDKKAVTPPDSNDSYYIRGCLNKLAKFDLLDDRQEAEQISEMLKQESEALARIRAADRSFGLYRDFQAVSRLAKSLKQSGDRRGMDLINDYFKTSDGNERDSSLYEHVGQMLMYEDDITPAMIEGLRKIQNHNVSRGCQFFNEGRFEAQHAKAVLIAIDKRGPQHGTRSGYDDFCVKAFRSQLRISWAREAFFKDIYPELTPQQKTLADELSKEAPVQKDIQQTSPGMELDQD